MAPNTSPKLTPPRRSLTSKGFERKKPGPVPKPLSERLKKKPLKQVKRIERSYSRERKVEVLLYLLQHRVPDTRLRKVPRRRIGQPHEEELTQPMVTNEYGEYVWYRAPTYSEASEFWKIPTPTIQGWWDAREKILEGTGIQIPQVGPGGFSTAIADQIGPEGESGGEGSPSGDGGPSGERSPSGQGEPATTNGAPPTPSSSPNAASAPSTTRPGPGSAPVPKPVLHPFSRTPPPPPVEMLPPDWKPPTSPRVIGLMAPARPTRGSNGGFRIEGTQAPRLAPAPPGPVGHAVPQGPRHVAGPPHAYAGPHPPSPPGIPPPAFNPAHYVVLYTGPHPGGPWDFPGQHYLPPGVALPIVYANQPVGVAPAGFVSVYPAPPAPVPNGPAPNTTHHPHHYPNPTIGQPPVSHGVHAPLHRPYPPQGPPQPPQPPSFNGKSPITPSDGPTLPAAQTPYSGPTGYVSPYAPHGVAGPRPIAPAHSPPPTPTANAGAGNPPKVAIPRLTPNRMADQTQPAPPPPPSAQPTGPPQQKHHQTTPVVVDDNDDDDGSIIKSRDQTQNAGSCTRGGEEDSTSDTSTPSDGKGGRASSQTSSPPEGAVAQGEAALVPAGNTILETETAQASETDMKNSTTSDPAVSEDEETTAAETEANQASSLSAEVGQETLMMDIDTEQHASPTSSEENDEDSEDQYLTPAEEAVDTPSIESIVEDVMMQVSMETPGAGDDGIE